MTELPQLLDAVFVVHYSRAQRRKADLVPILADNGLATAIWVEEWDKDDLGPMELARYLSLDQEVFRQRCALFPYPYRRLRAAEVSCAIKHVRTWERIARDSLGSSLILEDDVRLARDFPQLLASYLSQLPETWDLAFLGDGCQLHASPDELVSGTDNVYRKQPPYGRCTDSYLISLRAAGILSNELLSAKLSLPIGHEMNRIAVEHGFDVYWLEPTIATQLSQSPDPPEEYRTLCQEPDAYAR